jgi:hypothetical protein
MTWRALSISPYRGVSAIEAEPVVYAVMSVGGRVGEDEDVRAVFAGGGKWRPYHLVPLGQGLTLVHFSAQLERFVWDRGCATVLVSPF